MALMLRFIKNVKTKVKANKSDSIPPIDVCESESSFQMLIRLSQYQSFKEDVSRLDLGKQPKKGSTLHSLNPFFDDIRLLRTYIWSIM